MPNPPQVQDSHTFLRQLSLCLLFILGICSLSALEYNVVHTSEYIAYYSPEPISSSMRRIASLLDDRIADLHQNLGLYPTAKVAVYIVPDKHSYRELSIGRADIIEFSDAFYSGSEGRIYIRSGDQIEDSYTNVLMHEYIHWYVEQYFISTPLWFHEGMAVYFSGQLGYERYLVYLRESLRGKKGNLYRLSYNYPQERRDWELFYLSSAMAVRYMQNSHTENWKEFWDIVAAGHRAGGRLRFSEVFVMSYRTSVYDFTRAFEVQSRRQGYLYLFAAVNGIIFLILPVVMLVIARKRRKILNRMQDYDLPEESEPEDQIQG